MRPVVFVLPTNCLAGGIKRMLILPHQQPVRSDLAQVRSILSLFLSPMPNFVAQLNAEINYSLETTWTQAAHTARYGYGFHRLTKYCLVSATQNRQLNLTTYFYPHRLARQWQYVPLPPPVNQTSLAVHHQLKIRYLSESCCSL